MKNNTTETKPIKRSDALKPLSREHHYSLQLVWKIRQGIRLNVEVQRIKKYIKWFYVTHELDHIKFEETYLLPLLTNEPELVKKIQDEHLLLTNYFENKSPTKESLLLLADFLEAHIRYEERDLFNHIQQKVGPEQLLQLKKIEAKPGFIENEKDLFWI